MSEDEKIRYQICTVSGLNATPIDWNKLPEDLINKLLDEKKYMMVNKKSYSSEKEINEKTVVYFRKVSKFRKDITEYPGIGNIVFGI